MYSVVVSFLLKYGNVVIVTIDFCLK